MADRGKYEEADKHPCGASHERLATAVVLDDIEAVERRSKINTVKYHLGHEAVVDADGSEDRRSVVEEVVCTGQLLETLEANTKGKAVCHAWGKEHLVPFTPPRVTCGFGGELGRDLFEFRVHGPVIIGNAIDFCHCSLGFVDAAVTVGVARGLREEEDANAEDDCPEEADAHGDAPGAAIEALFGAEVDKAGEKDTERDEKLVGTLSKSVSS